MGRKNDFRRSLIGLWREKGHKSISRTRLSYKALSHKTRQDRYDFLINFVDVVHRAGLKITYSKNIDTRHIRVMVTYLESRNYAIGTMNNKLSMLRMLCIWINKDSMIPLIQDMLTDPDRWKQPSAASRDRSWSPELFEKSAIRLASKNASMAVSLLLMDALGLRVRESMLLKPCQDFNDGKLHVTRGTKGGRPREICVDTDYQRNVLEIAKHQAHKNGGSLIPRGNTQGSWRNRFYSRMRILDITIRGEGFTCHGLRHGYAQQLYQVSSGQPAPIRNGVSHDMVIWEKTREKVLKEVCNEVFMSSDVKSDMSSRLGHSRPQITDMYIGRKDSDKGEDDV